jgi:hypothetical protein
MPALPMASRGFAARAPRSADTTCFNPYRLKMVARVEFAFNGYINTEENHHDEKISRPGIS